MVMVRHANISSWVSGRTLGVTCTGSGRWREVRFEGGRQRSADSADAATAWLLPPHAALLLTGPTLDIASRHRALSTGPRAFAISPLSTEGALPWGRLCSGARGFLGRISGKAPVSLARDWQASGNAWVLLADREVLATGPFGSAVALPIALAHLIRFFYGNRQVACFWHWEGYRGAWLCWRGRVSPLASEPISRRIPWLVLAEDRSDWERLWARRCSEELQLTPQLSPWQWLAIGVAFAGGQPGTFPSPLSWPPEAHSSWRSRLAIALGTVTCSLLLMDSLKRSARCVELRDELQEVRRQLERVHFGLGSTASDSNSPSPADQVR